MADVVNSKVKVEVENLFMMIYPALANFPKSEKHGMSLKIKNTFIDLIFSLVEAENRPRARRDFLMRADSLNKSLKIIFRLSNKFKYIGNSFYEKIDLKLSEIGKQIGGWMKSTK